MERKRESGFTIIGNALFAGLFGVISAAGLNLYHLIEDTRIHYSMDVVIEDSTTATDQSQHTLIEVFAASRGVGEVFNTNNDELESALLSKQYVWLKGRHQSYCGLRSVSGQGEQISRQVRYSGDDWNLTVPCEAQ